MAALVDNPYESQNPVTGIVNGVMTRSYADDFNKGAASTGSTTSIKPVANNNPTPNLSLQQYTAQTSAVDKPTETVAGQVDSILAKDGPLMERARALALQGMNRRGLVNSSMSAGAGVAAMTDQATQIGGADAQIYNQRALANMDATNRAGEFNAGENNNTYRLGLDIASRFGLQKDQQSYSTGEREASQAYNTGERAAQNTFNATEREAGQKFSTGEREASQGYNTGERTANQNFTAGQNELSRDQQDRLTAANQNFTALQSQLDREQQVKITNLQDSLNNGTVPKTFAANTSLAAMNQINAILADKDIKPEDKKAATQNIIDIANNNLQWGATFYGTPLPAISTPNGTASGMINPGAQPAVQPAAAVTPASIPRNYDQYFSAQT